MMLPRVGIALVESGFRVSYLLTTFGIDVLSVDLGRMEGIIILDIPWWYENPMLVT